MHRHGERWTWAEDATLTLNVQRQSVETLARRLGRSPRAVRKRFRRLNLAPTRDEWLTSTQAAAVMGCTPQWVTHLARQGRIRARRVPGGAWWLIDCEGVG